jgi:hypothetical protein
VKKLYKVHLDGVVAADDSGTAGLIVSAVCGNKCTVFSVHEIIRKEDLPANWCIDAYPIRSIWKDETIGDILDARQIERQKTLDKVHVLKRQIATLQKEVDELSKGI